MAKPAPQAPQAGGAEIMAPGELKPLLIMSKRDPVACAIGMTKDKHGVILLHRKMAPRKLLGELRAKAREAKMELDGASLRFGHASVDSEADSSKVLFTVNKEASGALRTKLLEKLKRAGFQKCEIGVDQSLDAEDGPEHGAAGPDAGASPAIPAAAGAGPVGTGAAQPAAAGGQAPNGQYPNGQALGGQAANGQGQDASAVAARLTSLLRRAAAAANGSAPPALAQVAAIARDALRSQDLAKAGQACTALERLLDGMASGGAKPAAAAAGGARTGHGSPKFDTGRKVWLGTRAKLRGDIDAALKEIAAHYSDDNPALRAVRNRVERMMDQFDDSLAVKLADVAKNKDPSAHDKLVREAEAVIARYRSYVAGEDTLALLDKNPFHPLHVQKTLDTALVALANVVETA